MDEIFPYTPRKTRFETLEKTFVAREALREELIKSIRDQSTAENLQHWMILGTRGMGKSHLITLIYHMVKQDDYLKTRWIPLLMNEEEHEVFSLHTLFIRFLTKLGDELNKEADPKAEQVYDFLQEMREEGGSPDEIREAVVSYLKDYVMESGRKLVVLLENADDLLMGCIPKKNEINNFRKILQHENFLMFVATSPTFFERIKHRKAALFGFFRIRRLDLLDYNHAVILLRKWAEIENNKKLVKEFETGNYRLKVLYHLTGGNPRILMFLYMAISGDDGLTSAVKTFGRLLEKDLSNYYLSRMRDLPNQEQPIVLALAESNRNLTQTEIGKKTFLPIRSVGTAMVRLENAGLVRPVSKKKGKNTLYTLTDHLFRLWHQWRTHLRERTVIEAVVEFLSIWYKKKELETWTVGQGVLAEYSKEALNFRMSDKFQGHLEVLHSESKELLESYLQEKDYHSFFETMEFLRDCGLNTSNIESTVLNTVQNGSVNEAKKSFRSMLKHDEKDNKAYMAIGYILFNNKDYSGAEEVFSRVVELIPKDSEAWKLLGHVRNKQKNYAEAEEALQKTVGLNPKDSEAWVFLGDARFYQKNYAGTEEAISQAIELNPKNSSILGLLAIVRGFQKNYEGAEEALLEVVEIDPKNSEAWKSLGRARFNQKDNAGTEEALSHAVELNPKDSETLKRLGHVSNYQRNYKKTEEAFSRVVKLDPKDSEAWKSLGSARYNQKDYAGAEEALLKAVELDPKDSDAWRFLGNVRNNQENYAGAEETLLKAVELNPKDSDAWQFLGVAQGKLGNHAEAEKAFSKAIERDPKNTDSWNNLVICSFYNYRFTKSAKSLLHSIELDRQRITNYSNACEIFFRDSEAINPFTITKKALSNKETNNELKSSIYLFRAMLYLHMQEQSNFKKDLQKGLEFMSSSSKESQRSIKGELIDFLVDIVYKDNIEEVKTYITILNKLSPDFASIFAPLNPVIDYFKEYYLVEKKNILPAKRAQQVLERVPAELRGPVEEMIEKVKKNIKWWEKRPKKRGDKK